MSWTTRFRFMFVMLFVITVLAALAGWLVLGRQPVEVAPIIGWLTTVIGIGEASNIGKRATFNPQAGP